MKVKIPFNDWSKERLHFGMKTSTSRTKKYGKPGDTFDMYLEDGILFIEIPVTVTYEIVDVEHAKLGFIKEYCFLDEGCLSPGRFEDIWKKIHPKKGFDHEQKVYYHKFKIKDIHIHFEKSTEEEKRYLIKTIIDLVMSLAEKNAEINKLQNRKTIE